MKREYDFSKAVRGKFYRKGAELRLPIYLDPKLQSKLEHIARRKGKGGGLVVQYEMLDWMASHGIAARATLSVPGVERQFLDRDGSVIQRFPDSTPFTSWEAVFHQLRAAFPNEFYR